MLHYLIYQYLAYVSKISNNIFMDIDQYLEEAPSLTTCHRDSHIRNVQLSSSIIFSFSLFGLSELSIYLSRLHVRFSSITAELTVIKS